ncbi:MAG: HDOD domain-containing protein [Gammaproteobacteria bacterium]
MSAAPVSKQKERPDFMKGIYIPPQPAIIEEIRDASPDLPRIAKLIGKDAGISANVIRTVNSPAYNLPNKISSINQAVMMLGLDSVINIVNGLMIRTAFEKYNTDDLVEFWELNEEMALCCSLLARRFDVADTEQAYLLGLFHNCGIPAMAKKFPNYNGLLREAYSQLEVAAMEYISQRLNTNHTLIGYLIARNWKLPDPVSEAIREQGDRARLYQRSPPTDGLLICLKLAEQICAAPRRLSGVVESAQWPVIAEEVFRELCISEEDFADLEHEIREQMILVG